MRASSTPEGPQKRTVSHSCIYFFLTTLTLHSLCTARARAPSLFRVMCGRHTSRHDLEDLRRIDRQGESLERMSCLVCRRISLQCHHSHSPDQQQFRPRGRVNFVDAALSSSTSTSALPCRLFNIVRLDCVDHCFSLTRKKIAATSQPSRVVGPAFNGFRG
jgi:hypothetical protein